MSEELYFDVELRRLLDGIGFSDCGENDEWNFWYQRVHKAHDQTIDRVTEVQRAENAKLRELVRDLWLTGSLCDAIPDMRLQAKGGDWRTMQERVDEALGIEEDS